MRSPCAINDALVCPASYWSFYNGVRLHQALGYSSPQVVFRGD
jgi:hypothetical protein